MIISVSYGEWSFSGSSGGSIRSLSESSEGPVTRETAIDILEVAQEDIFGIGRAEPSTSNYTRGLTSTFRRAPTRNNCTSAFALWKGYCMGVIPYEINLFGKF